MRAAGGAVDKVETGSTTSSQARVNESIAATARANRTEEDARDMIDVLEARRSLTSSRPARADEAAAAVGGTARSEEEAQDLIDMLEARKKMK